MRVCAGVYGLSCVFLCQHLYSSIIKEEFAKFQFLIRCVVAANIF